MKKMVHTPEGVRDIYGDELHRKNILENSVKKVINSYGFEDIETPTFEYFDVFSKEIGTTSSKELYKFFDKEGETLCLRPDFTPSVARCVAKYFDEVKTPIRLTYSGKTFINNSNLQGKLKESTQVGCELMNDDSPMADAEMINLVIDSLKSCGLKDFQICVGEMNFFKGLCKDAGINEEDELVLREFISTKNFFSANEMIKNLNCNDKVKDELFSVVNCVGSIDMIDRLKTVISNERSLKALERLTKVYELLKCYGNQNYVSFDLGILSKYNYYTGIIFKAYTYGIGDALVKGGRYDNLLESFGTSKPAIGFVVVIDDLLMALKSQNLLPEINNSVTEVIYDENNLSEKISLVKKMREEGKSVKLVKAYE